MSDNTKRLEWLDALRGIIICDVLIWHCQIPGFDPRIIDMPAFYIISGFCWNQSKYQTMSLHDFIQKKFRSYGIPYLKIAATCFVLFGIIWNAYNWGINNDFFIKLLKYLFGIFVYSRGTYEWLPNCSPIWCLSTLFFAEIIFYFIMRHKSQIMLVIGCGLLGYICSMCGKYFPLNIDNAFTCVPFLYIGFFLKKYWNIICDKIYIGLLVPIILIPLYLNNFHVDFANNSFDNLILTYLFSALIIIGLFSVVCQIKRGG